MGDDDNKPVWSQTLFDWSTDLPSDCIPLHIPGLAALKSISSTKSTAPKNPPSSKGPTGQTCTPPGKTGICQSTSAPCPGGSYIPNYCPGDSSIQCCPSSAPTATTTCNPPGKTGLCQETSTPCAGGSYISGYCPGDDSVKCCPSATPSGDAGGGGGCKREVVVGIGGVERRMFVC